MSIKNYFASIATAIRTKGSTSALITPADMPQAILDLPSGGSSDIKDMAMTPIYYDLHNGFVSNGTYYASPGPAYCDVYQVSRQHVYYLTLGNIVGNRFRAMLCDIDPTTLSEGQTISGTILGNDINDPAPYSNQQNYINLQYAYIIVAKSTTTSGLKSYLFEITDL